MFRKRRGRDLFKVLQIYTVVKDSKCNENELWEAHASIGISQRIQRVQVHLVDDAAVTAKVSHFFNVGTHVQTHSWVTSSCSWATYGARLASTCQSVTKTA
jgi:hypothetical protein